MALDLSTIDDRAGLASAIAGKSDDQINESLAGRSAAAVNKVAGSMKTYFRPEKAAKQNAVIQYDVKTPDGVMTFQVKVANGQCDVQEGAPQAALATLNVSLPNFLRLASGKLGGLHAIVTGRLSVSGDVLLARRMEGWFKS
jgi:putative sterol carrier protein